MHGASILDETMRAFLIWMLQLIIVHSLCLRQRFSFRYPLVLFALAVATLPFLVFNPGEIERAHVDTELGVQGDELIRAAFRNGLVSSLSILRS